MSKSTTYTKKVTNTNYIQVANIVFMTNVQMDYKTWGNKAVL